ncbi:MAG: hypothetical protein OXU38_12845 [Gemmatimonadota bacterium]|nr:hypothetical protein [Gemmatimonadota bacterium]
MRSFRAGGRAWLEDSTGRWGWQANRRVEVAIFASEEMQREMLRRHGG